MAGLLTRKKEQTEGRPAPGGTVTRYYGDWPFALSRLRDEFDQLFDYFARQWPGGSGGNGWRWGLEAQDEQNALIVRAEAPGFEPGDFNIQVRGNELVLHAEKKIEKEEKERGYHEERRHTCYQAVALPPGIDADKVTATYHNGVLTVTLPKTPEGKGRRVPINGS